VPRAALFARPRAITSLRLSSIKSDLRWTRFFGTSTTTSRSSVNVCPIFWRKLQLEVEKLVAHIAGITAIIGRIDPIFASSGTHKMPCVFIDYALITTFRFLGAWPSLESRPHRKVSKVRCFDSGSNRIARTTEFSTDEIFRLFRSKALNCNPRIRKD